MHREFGAVPCFIGVKYMQAYTLGGFACGDRAIYLHNADSGQLLPSPLIKKLFPQNDAGGGENILLDIPSNRRPLR